MLSATSASVNVYGLSLNGSTGRGELVVNDGSRMLHPQFAPATVKLRTVR